MNALCKGQYECSSQGACRQKSILIYLTASAPGSFGPDSQNGVKNVFNIQRVFPPGLRPIQRVGSSIVLVLEAAINVLVHPHCRQTIWMHRPGLGLRLERKYTRKNVSRNEFTLTSHQHHHHHHRVAGIPLVTLWGIPDSHIHCCSTPTFPHRPRRTLRA